MFLKAEFTTTVSNEDVPVNKVVPELCACILVVTLGACLLLPFPTSPSQQSAVATPLQKALSHPVAALSGTSGTVFPCSPT